MFVARAATLLDLLAENHPELSSALRAIAADPSTLEERWPGLEKIAIDHAVAEPAAACRTGGDGAGALPLGGPG